MPIVIISALSFWLCKIAWDMLVFSIAFGPGLEVEREWPSRQSIDGSHSRIDGWLQGYWTALFSGICNVLFFIFYFFSIFLHTFWASSQTLITGEAHALVPVIRPDSSWLESIHRLEYLGPLMVVAPQSPRRSIELRTSFWGLAQIFLHRLGHIPRTYVYRAAGRCNLFEAIYSCNRINCGHAPTLVPESLTKQTVMVMGQLGNG